MTPFKWFLTFLKKYKKLMVLGMVMTTALAALSIVNPYIRLFQFSKRAGSCQ